MMNRKIPLPEFCSPLTGTSIGGDPHCDHDYPPEHVGVSDSSVAAITEPVCLDCGSLTIALPEVRVPDWHEIISARAAKLGLPFPTYEHCMTWADQRRVPEGLLEEKALAVANLPTGVWEGHSGNRKPRYHDPWLTLTNWVRGAMNKKQSNSY